MPTGFTHLRIKVLEPIHLHVWGSKYRRCREGRLILYSPSTRLLRTEEITGASSAHSETIK
ncbi:hypothetical protein CaCOL14_003142 [Colletotrichum acutatum]